MSFMKHNKAYLVRDNENYFDMEDDLVFILNIYSKRLVQERTGKLSK